MMITSSRRILSMEMHRLLRLARLGCLQPRNVQPIAIAVDSGGRVPVHTWYAVFGAVAALGIAVRYWALRDRLPLMWADSDNYMEVSQAPFWSWDFWAGERTLAVPLLLRLVGRDPERYLDAMALIASLCWAALAAALAAWLPAGWRRWVGAAAVAAFSFTFPVMMWERSVLSESLALSLLVLVLAPVLALWRTVDGWRIAGVLGAVALWLIARDTHAVVVLMAGVALCAWLVIRLPARTRELAILGIGAFVLAGLAFASSAHGQRHQFPLRNVYGVRILPYPDRVEWFSDHGMPQGELFVDPDVPDARLPIRDPGKAPVVWIGADDPVLQPWLRWAEWKGRSTLALWMATHPDYTLFEPWRDPERAFNNAEGDRTFYAAPDRRDVPYVTGLFFPPRLLAFAALAVFAGQAFGRGTWRSPLFLVGAGAVLLAAPHGLVSWHSDGMETARHLLVPVVQFNLGLLLVGVAGVLASRRPAAEGSPRRRRGRPAR